MTRGALKYEPKSQRASESTSGKRKTPDSSKQSFPTVPIWIKDRDSKSTAPIFFWKPHEAWGFLGQWYPSSFREPVNTDCNEHPDCERCEAERKRFSCCEQYMMYRKAIKFEDMEIAEQILATENPGQMKALGRMVKGFNDYSWEQVRYDIVISANLLKFGLDDGCEAGSDDGFTYGGTGQEKGQESVKLREMLLSTGTRELVEASALDRIWGIGFSPKTAKDHGDGERLTWGKNLLGKALMEVRRRIRVQEGLEVDQTNTDIAT